MPIVRVYHTTRQTNWRSRLFRESRVMTRVQQNQYHLSPRGELTFHARGRVTRNRGTICRRCSPTITRCLCAAVCSGEEVGTNSKRSDKHFIASSAKTTLSVLEMPKGD